MKGNLDGLIPNPNPSTTMRTGKESETSHHDRSWKLSHFKERDGNKMSEMLTLSARLIAVCLPLPIK